MASVITTNPTKVTAAKSYLTRLTGGQLVVLHHHNADSGRLYYSSDDGETWYEGTGSDQTIPDMKMGALDRSDSLSPDNDDVFMAYVRSDNKVFNRRYTWNGTQLVLAHEDEVYDGQVSVVAVDVHWQGTSSVHKAGVAFYALSNGGVYRARYVHTTAEPTLETYTLQASGVFSNVKSLETSGVWHAWVNDSENARVAITPTGTPYSINLNSSPLSNVVGVSTTRHPVMQQNEQAWWYAYATQGVLFLRSSDFPMNFSTTDPTFETYTVPQLNDGFYESVSVGTMYTLSEEKIIVIGVSTSGSKRPSFIGYNVDQDEWTKWHTAPNGTVVPGTLSLHSGSIANELISVAYHHDTGTGRTLRHYLLEFDNLDNKPPTANAFTKGSFDAIDDTDFAWEFVDADAGDYQTAYQLVVYDNEDSSLAFDTGKVTSDDTVFTLSGGSLTNGKEYYYRVRVWDRYDEPSPYSTEEFFTTRAKPTVNITTPVTDGALVSSGRLTVVWDYSDTDDDIQRAYRVRLYAPNGSTMYNSGKTLSSVNFLQIPVDLTNNTSYSVSLRVWDQLDVESNKTTRIFTTDFELPTKPNITLFNQGDHMRVVVDNGAAEGVSHNEIWRMDADGFAVRLSDFVGINSNYRDYTATKGVSYFYFARAVGGQNNFIDSNVLSGSLTFMGIYLHDVNAPRATIQHFLYDGSGRTESWQAAVGERVLAGRVNSVFEYGENEQYTIVFNLQLPDVNAKQALDAMVRNKSILCYRDSRGRKVFGVIDQLNFNDTKIGNTIQATLRTADYIEGA